MPPLQAVAHQQRPEDTDEAVLPVAGHGAGLTPGLLSSVEPIGIVGTPSCDVAGVEALDCEAVGLPAAAEAGPHVVVIGAGDPGSVAPDMAPTPPPLNCAVELDVPAMMALLMPGLVIALPGLEHAVAEATPFEVPEVTPGVASGAAPNGIPVGATAVPEVLKPRGEVVPIPAFGVSVPIPPTCACAQLKPTNIAVAMAIKRRVIAAS
jgi:hypothetical protein